MRHRIKGFKLGRDTEHRKALWRNQAIALFTHGQITTTVPKAKAVQPFVEKLITAAKKGDLASRRRVLSMIGDPILIHGEDDENIERNKYGEVVKAPKVVKHLFEEIAPKFADRAGGCTRIVKLGTHRLGDGGDLCVLMLVGDEEGPQVSGQFSRRRDKANKRMVFAAQLRKGAESSSATDAASESAGESATAVAEPEVEAQGEADGGEESKSE